MLYYENPLKIHPAILAHVATTYTVMLLRRFFLGVGTGKYFSEYGLGDVWPQAFEHQHWKAGNHPM